jgi:hypothetical protein
VKKVIEAFANIFIFKIEKLMISNVHNLVRKRAIIESSDYAFNNMKSAFMFRSRHQLWDYCIKIAKNKHSENGGIAMLEFGVFEANSINYFADKWPDEIIFGFDSFEGLQEDWGGELPQGFFNLGGKLPKVKSNVRLVKGLVQNTLPKFVEELESKRVGIIHFDLDTFSPTKFYLETLSQIIKRDTVIIFDEYLSFPSWQDHEFRAWKEFVADHGIEYQYLGYTNVQVGIIIK